MTRKKVGSETDRVVRIAPILAHEFEDVEGGNYPCRQPKKLPDELTPMGRGNEKALIQQWIDRGRSSSFSQERFRLLERLKLLDYS